MMRFWIAGAAALALTTSLTAVTAHATPTDTANGTAETKAAAPAVINAATAPTAASSAAAPEAMVAASAPSTKVAAAGDAKATEAIAAKPVPPATTLRVSIDLNKQRMTVSENGQTVHSWPISSGRSGYRTPNGTYRPTWMSKMHYSRKYDNAPMPHAVFFTGGFAIHGTYATGMLGRPASHGCVRLSPSNAKTLFNMVGRHGRGQTQISLHGTARDSAPKIARKPSAPKYTSNFWDYDSEPVVTKPRRRYGSASGPRRAAPPKVVYRNGQPYMYVGPQAAKQYWRKNSYSGGYSANY